MQNYIPVYQPSLGDQEKKNVLDCLDSTWISSKGKYLAEFEEGFSKFIGARYSTAVSNGTVALHLALVTLGIGPGDEVIVPTLTYIASVNAIVYTGATPVFVDSLPDSWQMDPDDVRKKITPKTKAIMAVHLYGASGDLEAYRQIANERQIFLVEDCAEAIGTRFKNQHVGTFGHISTFSFFGNKTITTGEGGMVVTNDRTLYERAIHYKGQGLAAHRQYWHDVVGYNYRMTNICAAIGVAQLAKAELLIQKKRQIAEWYKEGLKNLPLSVHGEPKDTFHSYWMVSILVDEPQKRDALRDALAKNQIETRPVFYPVHTMPMYSHPFQQHPVAESIGWRGINLPSWPDLTRDQVQFICERVREYFG